MRISRLFVESVLSPGNKINLDEQSRHYIATVLRLKIDAELTLFNGSGNEFSGRLVEINRKTAIVEILAVYQPLVESHLKIHFGQAISRSERMDFAIQKSVELGVNCITPLLTDRCVVHLKDDKKNKKTKHWQKIACHAAEQSGRTQVPVIAPIMLLRDWLEQQQGLKIFLDPYAQKTLIQIKFERSLVTLLSGPEGGFSEQERQMALDYSFHAIKLGPRILRTETAALAAIASIQTLWGDFN